MKHLPELRTMALKVGLDVEQNQFPPGGYSVQLLALGVKFTDRAGLPVQRYASIWCRNLFEVEQAILTRPKFRKAYDRKPRGPRVATPTTG